MFLKKKPHSDKSKPVMKRTNDDQLRKFLKKLSPYFVENMKGEYGDIKIAFSNASNQNVTLKTMKIRLGSSLDEIISFWNIFLESELFEVSIGSSSLENPPPNKSSFMDFKEFPRHWCNIAHSSLVNTNAEFWFFDTGC